MSSRILALVCARVDSQGVPGKNFRILDGEPLLMHSIRHARESLQVDHVVVVTNKSVTLDVIRIERPPALEGPDAAKWEVWQYAVREYERTHGRVEIAVDLDVTRPLRHPHDVDAVIHAVRFGMCDGALAVAPARRNPYQDILELIDGRLRTAKVTTDDDPIFLRQHAPATYDHGGITAMRRDYLFAARHLFDGMITPVIVDPDTVWDIDSETEWAIVEMLHARTASATS